MSTKGYSKEVREKVPGHRAWQGLVMFLMLTSFFLFLDCLFEWSFNIWLPIFFVLFLVVAHRYGTLLEKADRELKLSKLPANFNPFADKRREFLQQDLYCPNPSWIQIKGYPNYEIHCETYEVRDRHLRTTLAVVEDPHGVHKSGCVYLIHNREIQGVYIDWIIENTLGRKVP